MTPKARRFAAVVCLLLCLCMCFAACRGQGETQPTGGSSDTPASFALEVKSEGGTALEGISVYVYADSTLEDLVAVVKTDAEGKASFTYAQGSYVAVLTNVPDGYVVEDCYPITGESTTISLPVKLVDGDLTTATYGLGDVMQDFTFTDVNGTEYRLSELLQQKKAVVLNFWYMNCGPCKAEFPYLQEAYEAYADQIEVLAMNSVEDDNAAIKAFAEERGLTFPIGACERSWESAMRIFGYPTTVVIDRYGTVALVHSSSIPSAESFKSIFKFFADEGYTQTAVENVEDLFEEQTDETAVNNPVDISGQLSFELTIEPGKVHYLNIHKVSNVWMQINNSDIFVEYGGKKFTASGGSVGLLVSAPSTFEPAQLGFGNSGDKTQTFTVTLSALAGSYGNPYTMQPGEFTTSVSAGNNQGVYFEFTAKEDGHFSLQCLSVSPKVDYDFSIMNLTTSAMRNMSGEGQTDPVTGNSVVTMAMNQGEKLRIIISTLPDSSNNYPGASFKMKASFTAGDVEDVVVVEKQAYAVTVTDENRQPVAGVNVTLNGTQEGSKISWITDETGVASGMIAKDTYQGSIVIPVGYLANTTKFQLTEEKPFASLKLDTHVIEMADYVVRVIDEDGAPVPGVLITIGTVFGTTDEDGVYTVNLEKGSYTAVLGVPAGYKADAISVPFPENSTLLAVTLKHADTEDQTGTAYTVKVVDAAGNPMQDIVVTYHKDGEPVTMASVNAEGVAIAYLEAGDYTVSLTGSSGAALKHDRESAKLSVDKTETTITVASDISGQAHQTAYWGNYYKLSVGSSWIDLSKQTNYVDEFGVLMYVFNPGTSGVYRVSTDEGAVVGSYGSINFPNGPIYSTDNEDGYFDLTIRDGEFANDNQPSLVLGLRPGAGMREATITIVRVADAPAELPVTIYEPAKQPEVFKYTQGGNLTYVNLKKAANIEKRSDGFYYLNGKKLYMNLSNGAPYLTISNMLGIVYDPNTESWGNSSMGTGMKGLIYDDINVIGIEDFTLCMWDYCKASDPISGLYPLDDDLIYIIKSCGSYMGWWNVDSPNYLFGTVEGLNTETAWMFAVCYAG